MNALAILAQQAPMFMLLMALGNVGPSLSREDFTDRAVAKVQFSGDFVLPDSRNCTPLADVSDQLVGEFGVLMSLPMRHLLLDRGITHVVDVLPEIQMSRVDASRVVAVWAVMANLHAIWDCAVSYLPRKSMGEDLLATAPAIRTSRPIGNRDLKLPVSFAGLLDASSPEPATIGLEHIRPEPLNQTCTGVFDSDSLSFRHDGPPVRNVVFRAGTQVTTASRSLHFNSPLLIAQRVIVNGGGLGNVHWWIGVAVVLVVLAGAVAIVFLVFRHLGVSVPPVIQAIIWVAVVIAVAVVALLFLRSLL